MSITIAVPKGRLGNDLIRQLQKSGIGSSIDLKSRKLIFRDEENDMEFVFLKNSDVITYVENGIADMGIVGSDVIAESDSQIYCLQKLDIGKCKMSVAGITGREKFSEDAVLKVATKFPRTAKSFFESRGQEIKIIKLNGSIELAPILGLSDVIVDIVETGNTLRANGLSVLEDICEISGYIISNRVSYKFNKKQMDMAIKAMIAEEKTEQKTEQA